MRYIGFNICLLTHDESGQAIAKRHYHIRRTMKPCELIIIADGVLHIQQREKLDVHAGEFALILPNEEHFGYSASDFKMHWTHFFLPEDFVISDTPNIECDVVLPVHGKLSHLERLILLSTQLENYERTPLTKHARNALITTIVSDLAAQCASQETPITNRRFHTILNFIWSNICNNQLMDVPTIAKTFGYNEKYLYMLFQKNLHITPHRYIIDRKLAQAAIRLRNTSDTVAAISGDLGYVSPQHFMKQFKQRYGVTPTEYRNRESFVNEIFLDDEQKR